MAGPISYIRLVPFLAGEIFEVARGAVRGWSEDRAASMGAAIAYYTVFSIAPILLLVIAIAGLAFGDQAAQGALVGNLSDVIGTEGAQALQALVKQAAVGASGPIATVVSLATMTIAATAVLAELQSALKVVWKVEAKPGRKIITAIKHRLLCLAIILACGVLLGASLATSTAITILSGYLSAVHAALPYVLGVFNVCVTLGMTTVLFGMIFKILPDAPIDWRDVWAGAAFTAVLFTVGKHLLSLYIGGKNVASVYGAAGALVIVLLWVYYSTQILLFGAEITRAHAERRRLREARRSAAPAAPVGAPVLETPPSAL
ncbi:MAG TPA: YihY/virulence factor BrkB family protein [Stellaceae bacterium]|nr:YihY/virulence factor BrkB family protein [Stellaceae bacterium]